MEAEESVEPILKRLLLLLLSGQLMVLAMGCVDPAAADEDEQRPQPVVAQSPQDNSEPRLRAVVQLVILGQFPEHLVAAVKEGLEEELSVAVETIAPLPLPRSAYYPPRRRYRAERLLSYLNERLEGAPDSTRVLGLTSVDISTTKGRYRDWGVMGLGELGGRSCVVSSFRLRRRARDAEHLRFRVVTTAVHEVGHTLGLEHCSEAGCLMRDAHGSIQTVDSSTGDLGAGCLDELNRQSPRTLVPHSLDPAPGRADETDR